MDFEERLNKPKRKLTEKQLKALAEGRKKQKIKREKEIIIETKHRQRKERIEREKVLNEQEEIKIYNKLMKKGNDKIREWKMIKYRHLDKANNIKEYNELKAVLDTIDEEDVLTGTHIEKLQQGIDQYKPKNPSPEPEDSGEDETEEIPPNSPPPPEEPIQLLIDPRDI
jgi:hypothetical protein|tara:strand:- start:147 stop:653 length:507 start_codon:yes stop_codon:yes gene_type:complete